MKNTVERWHGLYTKAAPYPHQGISLDDDDDDDRCNSEHGNEV